MRNRPQIVITTSSWIIGAAMLLLLPLNWFLAAATAAFFHEACHYGALRLCSVPIFRVQISVQGAKMDTAPMLPRQEFICALAGPLGGLILLLLFRYFPRIAICAGIQTLFNLLPLFPLDGGRALRCLCYRFLPPAAAKQTLLWTSRLCLLGILLLGALATFRYHLGFLPLLIGFGLCIRTKSEKLLAKMRS